MKISGCPIGAQLSRLGEHPDATLVVDAAEGHWRAIDDALSRIIGAQGVAALYRRSLSLTRDRHPWLGDLVSSTPSSNPAASLRSALSARPAAEAAAAQIALLQTFNDLLESLIGSSLTDRLLDPVWQQPPAARNAEDPSQ